MADQERARHELLARLEVVLGPEQAATLMENLPPRPWSELATKDDLAELRVELSGKLSTELGGLAAEMRREFAHLHEIIDLRFSFPGGAHGGAGA